MAHVEILRGISGSGKSTYARTQTDALIVSRDLIRPMFGVVGKTVLSPEKERLVTRIELDLIREALYRGQDVIVDNTNLNEQFATRYADLAHTMGATFSEKLFGVNVNVAVGRTDVPDSVVYRQAAQFAKIKPVVSRLPEPIRPIVMGGKIIHKPSLWMWMERWHTSIRITHEIPTMGLVHMRTLWMRHWWRC